MASSAALELIIGVTDKASGPLKNIGGALGGLAKFGAGAALGAAAVGVGALGAALATGIGDAREAAVIMAQTESVIKSTGGAAGVTADHVADLSGALSAASGKSLFGDSQIQESANLLLTFTNLKGGVLDAATAMSVDLAQAMGGAPADAALQLGKALNDPIAGIGALSRVGVTFTDQQKEQIKTMVEAGDVAGAQGVILGELNKEFGGSAAAAAAADGGMAQFKDRMGELAESVGAKVLPALNQLMGWLNSPEVQAGIEAIVDGLVNGLGAAFTWISETALPALQAAWTVVWPIIQSAMSTVIDWVTGTAWPALQTAFAWVVDTGLPALQGAFEAVWPAIKTAVQTTYTFLAETVWPWLRDVAFPWIINTGLPAVQAAFQAVWPIIQTAVKTVYAFLSETVWPWLMNVAFPWIVNTGLPAIQRAFEVVWPIIETAVRVVYTFFKDTVWPWLQEAFRHTTEEEIPAIKRAFEVAWPLIKTAVSTVYTFLKDTVWPWLSTAFTDIKTWVGEVQARWDTAWSAIGSAVDAAKNTISGAIATIKSLVDGAISKINTLISLINNIPGVNIPSIPTAPTGGGGSGFGAKSLDSGFQSVSSHTTYIDARGASDPRGIEAAVDRAMKRVGVSTDLRLRTT